MNKEFKPDDIVKSCKYLELGSCFSLEGICCCVHGTTNSPIIIDNEELKNGTVTHDLIVERKTELFEAINGANDKNAGACKNCLHLYETEYKNICFDYLGGEPLPASFNIQHYTECNERCKYCSIAQSNDFRKPQYDILNYFELFRKKGKLRGKNWIDFSGGEPAMLKNFDEILKYMMDNDMGTIVVYSNAAIYSNSIYEGLKSNKVILTTSLDTGLASTYKSLRGADVFPKVIENLIKYRNSGTTGLWLKYVVCEENRTEDDMWSFLLAMLAIRPNRVMLCPDFPYGDKEIPKETVDFTAKLWYLIEKFLGQTPSDYTSVMKDPKFIKYRKDFEKAVNELKEQNPLKNSTILKSVDNIISSPVEKLTFLQQVFSVRNECKHKVLRILGFKIKMKRRNK